MTPCKREDELVVERTDAEVLVYDLRTNAAHHLDADAAAVWEACDGNRSLAEVAGVTGLGVDAVDGTVGQLVELDLVSSENRHTRRETLQRSLRGSLVAAGTLAALPVIKSLSAPEAAQAASMGGSGAPCSTGGECASSVCTMGRCI